MSGPDLWIIVPSWERFQHYKDRNPPWIKLHTDLNSNDAWLRLTMAQRGLLSTIWVEYARSNGYLRASNLPSEAGYKHLRRHLESLNHAGFIALSASKPLALGEESRGEKNARTRAREENGPGAHAPNDSSADLGTFAVDEASLALAKRWSAGDRRADG